MTHLILICLLKDIVLSSIAQYLFEKKKENKKMENALPIFFFFFF